MSSASEKAYPGVLVTFLIAELPQKRGVLVHKNSFASYQGCRHSVEPRALTGPFKQSNLSAWSLLSWHSTHTYTSCIHTFEGHSLLCQSCLLSTVIVTPSDSDYVNRCTSLKQFRLKSTLVRGIWCAEEVGDHHGEETGLKCDFGSSRKMWTFGSGLLLFQEFRRTRKETAWKRRRIETSLVIEIFMLRVLKYVVSYKSFWHWMGVVQCASHTRDLIRQMVCYLILSLWMLDTNCFVVITEYWSLNRFHYRWIGGQNKKFEIKYTTEWLRRCLWKKMRRRPDINMQQNALQAILIKQNAPQAWSFDWILMGSLSYSCSMLYIFHNINP